MRTGNTNTRLFFSLLKDYLCRFTLKKNIATNCHIHIDSHIQQNECWNNRSCCCFLLRYILGCSIIFFLLYIFDKWIWILIKFDPLHDGPWFFVFCFCDIGQIHPFVMQHVWNNYGQTDRQTLVDIENNTNNQFWIWDCQKSCKSQCKL